MMRTKIAIAAFGLVAGYTAQAQAFCGFYVAPNDAPLYNDATMVALMREGSRTVLSMSNNYKGPAEDFAMVVPVPVVLQKENVKVLQKDLFERLEKLTAPRLVEYWEQDPCTQSMPTGVNAARPSAPGAVGALRSKAAEGADYGVTIEAKFAVGEYEVVVLSAEQSDGLERWLRDNKYNIPKGASAALAPYVKEQMKFFVAKVDITKVHKTEKGTTVLSPLRFHYEDQNFRLPVRLGLLNAKEKQDLLVFVLGSKRYEAANYANAFIPTNLDVKDETRNSFGSFYSALFDKTLANSGNKGVITEYSWSPASCDPCPTPPLSPADLASLGEDVIHSPIATTNTSDAGVPAVPPSTGSTALPAKPKGTGDFGSEVKRPVPIRRPFNPRNQMVLTRLHTRYDASTLGEDLVFRAAEGVVGGREFVVDKDGAIEHGV